MTAVRETLCNLRPMEIPRPKCAGFQFVPTRGRMGFYMSIKRDGEKYGIQLKNQGPRRPSLPDPRTWGAQQPSPNNRTSHHNNKNENEWLNDNVKTAKQLSQPHTSVITTEDLVTVKAHLLSAQRQVIIPEEPEELNEPEPDYESFNSAASKKIAVTSKQAPPAPPLPPSLLLNLRKASEKNGQCLPKSTTKRQLASKKKCKYEYLIEEEEGEDQVFKL